MRARGMTVVMAVVASLVTVLIPAKAVSAATDGPTGNPAAIAYYTRATDNLLAKPADRQVYSGAFYLGFQGPTWYLNWGTAHPRYAWERPVVENELFAVARHTIVWGTVTWVPACWGRTGCQNALRFFFHRGGSFWAYVPSPRRGPACWYPATGGTAWINTDFNGTGTQPWYAGGSPYTTVPDYQPMVRSGGMVEITSTFAYRTGPRVTETDTINPATTMFTHSSVHVAPYQGRAGYSSTGVISVPMVPPRAPRVNLC